MVSEIGFWKIVAEDTVRPEWNNIVHIVNIEIGYWGYDVHASRLSNFSYVSIFPIKKM